MIGVSQNPPQTAPASRPDDAAALHWSQQLGMRSLQVTLAAKTIDRCVLVPDAATYLDELMKWSAAGPGTRWPVLIEDDVLTPLFVRRFKPAELVRREAVQTPLPADALQRRAAIESVIVHALGGDPAKQSILQVFEPSGYRPPGVVVASTADPAWTAAVALAAGHAQPILWIDDDYGPVNGLLDDASARRLATQVSDGVASLKFSSAKLGDDIDAITLCRNLPVAVKVNLAPDQRLVKEGQYADGNTALSDFIGRNADGTRYAITGQIFGDEKRCAYMAMCSLFLPRDSATLLNAYGRDSEWGRYAMEGASDMLAKAGLVAQAHAGPDDMGEAGWRRLLVGGVSSDLVLMNSGGNDDFFILNGGQARPGDVPVLNQPAAVHLIHSWSLRSPMSSATVGGRWLEHGAYAMVGSCFEPFLSAFQPPEMLVRRCLAGIPLLVAARRWAEDGLSAPWRLVTIGDPLMLIAPPKAIPATRIQQPAGYGANLLDRARELMRKADAENDPAAYAESIRLLDLLSQDDIALQMWTLAQQRQIPSGRAASAALGVLFRRRDADGFLNAWNEGGPRTPIMLDMLWHLMGPRLGGMNDRDVLLQMENAVRPDMPAVDVERLAPILMGMFGKQHVQQFLAREIARTTNAQQQQQLREIAGRY